MPGPTKDHLKEEVARLRQSLLQIQKERDDALQEVEDYRCDLSQLRDELPNMEERVKKLEKSHLRHVATTEALGIYHAFMAGQISSVGQSALLMHLISLDGNVVVEAARRAGLDNLLFRDVDNLLFRDVDSLESKVVAELRNSRKIMAIKIYRTETGYGLKEAKEAVERIQAKYGL